MPGAAAAKVSGSIQQRTPNASAVAGLRLEETTPAGLYEALGVQTFQVSDGLYQFETYAVTGDDTRQLGTAIDGPGMTDMLLADADGNGQPDLSFAVGGGRGLKQYTVGVVDRPGYVAETEAVTRPNLKLRVREAPLIYRDPIDLREEGGLVEVWDQKRAVRLGTLRVSADALRRIEFVPAPDLEPKVRRRFLQPRV
ncbi:MAG: hypothetical protein AAGK78_12870 [Planctomycetota bacterium]